MSQLSERYASALFSLALEMDQLDSFQQDAKDLLEVFRSESKIQGFFASVQISYEEKKQLLEKAFKGQIHTMMFNFLNLLLDKKRIAYVNEILKDFISMVNAEKGIEEGTVYSARKLEKAQMQDLEKSMSLRLGKSVELTNIVDSSLISGVKIAVGTQVIDMSMKQRIERLKNELLKESR